MEQDPMIFSGSPALPSAQYAAAARNLSGKRPWSPATQRWESRAVKWPVILVHINWSSMTSPNYATSAGLKRLGNIPLCGGSSRVSLCNVKLTAQTRILYMTLSLHISPERG